MLSGGGVALGADVGSTAASPATALAGNSDEVNAGLDVTLTGGAVVANVYTGASLWYNPAGLARIDKPSIELTGMTLDIQVIKHPGLTDDRRDASGQERGIRPKFRGHPSGAHLHSETEEGEHEARGGPLQLLDSPGVHHRAGRISPAGTSPAVNAFAGRNSRLDFFHISTGVAGRFGDKRKQKVLFGGAFDLVVASSRVDDSYTLFYDDGTAGQISTGEVGTQTGFGFQPKLGLQWVPVPKVRIGFSVAAPTYVFAVLERFAGAYNQAPPAGTVDDPANPDRQLARGSEGRGGRGVWWACGAGQPAVRRGVR